MSPCTQPCPRPCQGAAPHTNTPSPAPSGAPGLGLELRRQLGAGPALLPVTVCGCDSRGGTGPARGRGHARAGPAHRQIRADSHVFPAPICFYFPFAALLLVNLRCCCLPF